MADTTFSNGTVIVPEWLNDVNDMVYNNLPYYVLTTDTHTEINTALTTYNTIVFKAGETYNLAGDVLISNSDRKIIVEKGATVINTGGRFTAYAVNNVEWLIDGWVKSIALTTVTSPVGWPAIPASNYYERGFIEFGGADPYTASAENFKVHGSGKVSGDWTGTPTFGPTIAFITNRKGIASWNARNVHVEGIEVFGFHGEAIYAYGGVVEQDNWLFKNNYVHDCNANALNFHGAGIANGLLITQNTVRNCYAGVEASAGSVIDNYVVDVVGNGVWTGEGVGNGPIRFTGNVIKNAGLASIRVSFDAITTHADVFVHDNYSIDPGNYGLYVLNATRISVRSNFFAGGAQVSGAYDLAIDTSPVGVVADNVGGIDVGGFYVGLIAFLASPTISHYNNISLAESSADPRYGGGVATVASTASMTLPLGSDVFSVTGTNTITSITATNNAGRKVTLIFVGALTFTDGSNLKLAGNLVTTADDTITLVCDGTNWFEVCRSVN